MAASWLFLYRISPTCFMAATWDTRWSVLCSTSPPKAYPPPRYAASLLRHNCCKPPTDAPAVFLNQFNSSILKSPANGRRLPVDRFRTVDCHKAILSFFLGRIGSLAADCWQDR